MKLTNIINRTLPGVAGLALATNVAAQDCQADINYSTTPTNTAYDLLLVETGSASIACTDEEGNTWNIKHQNNNDLFNGGRDRTRFSYVTDTGNSRTSFGVKETRNNGEKSYSAAAYNMRDLATGRLGIIGVVGEGFTVLGADYNGANFDAAFQLEEAGSVSESAYLGVHNEEHGVWTGYNLDNDVFVTGITNHGDFGAFGLVKNRTDGTGFANVRLAHGNKSTLFTPGTGRFVANVMAEYLPRPEFNSFPSFTRQGDLTAQIVHNNEPDNTYTQAEIGRRFGDFGVGLGYKKGDHEGPVGQIDYTKSADSYDFGATIRAEDNDAMLSIGVTKRWD